jgi:hypothetical protein
LAREDFFVNDRFTTHRIALSALYRMSTNANRRNDLASHRTQLRNLLNEKSLQQRIRCGHSARNEIRAASLAYRNKARQHAAALGRRGLGCDMISRCRQAPMDASLIFIAGSFGSSSQHAPNLLKGHVEESLRPHRQRRCEDSIHALQSASYQAIHWVDDEVMIV